MHEIIKTQDLSKEYILNKGMFCSKNRIKVIKALDHFDLTILSGEIVGLIGANGAGKSTAIKLMTGVMCPTEGTVRIFENDPLVHMLLECGVKEI